MTSVCWNAVNFPEKWRGGTWNGSTTEVDCCEQVNHNDKTLSSLIPEFIGASEIQEVRSCYASTRRFLITPAVQPESRVMRRSPLTTGVPWGRMCVDPVTRRNLVDVFELRISSSEITRSCYQVSLPGSLYCAAHFPERANLLAFREVQ